jgi:transposase-like protein
MLALMKAYDSGTKTVSEFCRTRQIPESTFSWWRKKLRAFLGSPPDKEEQTPREFVRLEPPPLFSRPAMYELALSDGRILRMPVTLPAETVAAILKSSAT